MNRELKDVDRVFKALADPTRIRIVGLLLAGEVCVCHIHETLGIPQSKASRHLAYLRRTGIVEGEKRGLWVYYRISHTHEGIVPMVVGAARECIGRLEVVQRDASRLAKRMGCCVPATPETVAERRTERTA